MKESRAAFFALHVSACCAALAMADHVVSGKKCCLLLQLFQNHIS